LINIKRCVIIKAKLYALERKYDMQATRHEQLTREMCQLRQLAPTPPTEQQQLQLQQQRRPTPTPVEKSFLPVGGGGDHKLEQQTKTLTSSDGTSAHAIIGMSNIQRNKKSAQS